MGNTVKPAPAASDHDDVHIEVGEPKTWAAGLPAVIETARQVGAQMGWRKGARTLLRLNQPDGFDCPGCAWPEPRRHVALRVLRERGQGRRRGGHRPAGHAGVLRRRTRSPSLAGETDYWLGQQGRLTTPMHRPPGDDALRADRAGTPRSPASARALARAGVAAPGRVLHVGAHEQRGRVRVPADRAGARHQQPPGLLEHVPRVERRRPRAGDRHRQGHGDARRHPRRRADPRRRPEPGHQPPPDAVGAGAGQAQRRGHRRDQPAARGRAAARSATRSAVSGVLGRGTALADLYLPIMVGADLALFQLLNRRLVHDDGRRSTGRSSIATATGSTSCAPTSTRSIPTPCWRPPGSIAARSTSCTAGSPAGSGSSSAGRWGSPSTARRSPPSRRSPTRCCCAAPSASRAPAPARCAATPTCRATARWASSRSPPAAFLDALEARFGFAPPRAARLRHRRRDRRDAPRRRRRVRRPRRQLRGRGAGHRRGGGGDGAVPRSRCRCRPSSTARTCGAAPRRSSCRASDAPSATAGRRAGAVRHGRGLDGHGPRQPRRQPARRRRSCAARSTSCARSRRPRSATTPSTGAPWPPTTTPFATTSPPSSRGATTTTGGCANRAGSPCPTARATARVFATDTGLARLTVNRFDPVGRAAGPPAAADGALARPVQHHDLRARRPLPRHRAGSPGGVREPGRPRRARVRRRRGGRHRRRVARRARPPGPGVPAGRLPDGAAGTCAAYFPEANVLVPLDSVADDSRTPTSKAVVVRLEHRQPQEEP